LDAPLGFGQQVWKQLPTVVRVAFNVVGQGMAKLLASLGKSNRIAVQEFGFRGFEINGMKALNVLVLGE
jgi:hypothetical protein